MYCDLPRCPCFTTEWPSSIWHGKPGDVIHAYEHPYTNEARQHCTDGSAYLILYIVLRYDHGITETSAISRTSKFVHCYYASYCTFAIFHASTRSLSFPRIRENWSLGDALVRHFASKHTSLRVYAVPHDYGNLSMCITQPFVQTYVLLCTGISYEVEAGVAR